MIQKQLNEGWFPYFVHARINKDWQLHPIQLWQLFYKHLYRLKFRWNFKIHHLVITKNGYYLCLTPTTTDLSLGLCILHRDLSREYNSIFNLNGPLFSNFQVRTCDKTYFEYSQLLKQMYQYPFKLNYGRVEKYELSSLSNIDLYKKKCLFEFSKIDNELFIFGLTSSFFNWINDPLSEDLDLKYRGFFLEEKPFNLKIKKI